MIEPIPDADEVLTILQLNSQCLRNKILDLEDLCMSECVDVVCVSEHWLASDEVDFYVPKNFIVAKVMCRNNFNNGGVGIFLKHDIEFQVVDVSSFCIEVHCELSCVQLTAEKLIILSVYRSPAGDIEIFFENFELAIKKFWGNNKKVAVCGDFNIEMANPTSRHSFRFLNLLRSLNLVCANKNPTRFKSCIDNIIVNFSEDLYTIRVLGGHFADHDPLLFKMGGNKRSLNKANEDVQSHIFVRRQTEDQIKAFTDCLRLKQWESISSCQENDMDGKMVCDSFFKEYIDLWHSCSPLVKCRSNCKKNTFKNKYSKLNWYTTELADSRKLMLSFFSMYKNLVQGTVHANTAYAIYLNLKKKYRKQIIEAKKLACEKYIENSVNKCKAAWEVISGESSPAHTQQVSLSPDTFNNYFLNSVHDLGNKFDKSITSAINLLNNSNLQSPNRFNWRNVTPDEVIKAASKLSNSTAMDCYWLSNSIVKQTIHLINVPLAFIFNKCFYEEYFPDLLKLSKVVPIFKKGDKSLPQNYRPVSLVPIFSKLFESIMYNQLNEFFESNNLISNSQFGFRKGMSTITLVQRIVEEGLEAFERKDNAALNLYDLTKAFDCVPFDILISKLEYYGIDRHSLNLIKSYLSNRVQYVAVKGLNSSIRHVITGVPQGSVLGPFLFIVAINDLPSNNKAVTKIYCDDTSTMETHNDLQFLNILMHDANNEVLNWFFCNKLHCNEDKTQSLILSLRNENIQNSVKLLGIYIDGKLNWRDQINNVCKKISRTVYLFWKLKSFVNLEYLRMAYFGLFQSHISYGILLWGHSTAVNDILLIQKKIIRIITGAGFLEHCKPLFISLRVCTVINLYIFHVLMYAKDNLHLIPQRLDIHCHNTRHRDILDLPQHRLSITSNSFKINSIKFFNRLPKEAWSTTRQNFKNKLYNWLLNNPFYSIAEFLESGVNFTF